MQKRECMRYLVVILIFAAAAQGGYRRPSQPLVCAVALTQLTVQSKNPFLITTPRWALEHSRKTVEEVATLVAPLPLPSELTITVHPPRSRLSVRTASTIVGYSHINAPSRYLGNRLDGRTVSVALVHEMGHKVASTQMLADFLNEPQVVEDSKQSFTIPKDLIGKFLRERINDEVTYTLPFHAKLKVFGERSYAGTEAEQFIWAYLSSEVVMAYEEIFGDLLAAIHTKNQSAVSDLLRQDNFSNREHIPESLISSRSFVKPLEPVKRPPDIYDFFSEVRWELGQSYLDKGFEDPEYANRLINVFYKTMRYCIFDHYKSSEEYLEQVNQDKANEKFLSEFKRLMAESEVSN